MARVYKRDKKWYMDVKHPQTSKRIRKVVPAETKREAERIMRAVLRKWELGEALPSERETVPFSKLMDEYRLTHIKGGANRRGAPHKQTTAASDEGRLARLGDHFGERPVAEIEAREYAAFLDGLLAAGFSIATRNRYLAVLLPMLRLAESRGWVTRRPSLPPMRAEPRRAETVLSDKDLAKLLAECDKTPQLGQRVRFLLYTAFRLGETLRSLQWQDVRFEDGTVVLRDTKSGQDAIVYLHGSALAILRHRYAEAAKAGLSEGAGKPSGAVWSGSALDDRSNLNKAFKKALKAAKLDLRYRLHDLRAQHAVALLRQGEDIETVRKALRHASITTTARYLRHIEGHVANAVRRLTFPAAL